MEYLFYRENCIVLLKLLLVHFLVDFPLQPESLVRDKETKGLKSPFLYLHSALQGIGSYLVLPGWNYWYLAVFIGLSHGIIDYLKGKKNTGNRKLFYFITDQCIHIIVLAICWVIVFSEWPTLTAALIHYSHDYKFLFILLGYLLCLWPAGHLINFITLRFQEQIINDGGLLNAGKYIGYIERILIITLILIHQFAAIGFLIAAKSLLRFREEDRRVTEYILYGTLLSFGAAIFVGIIVNSMIKI